MDVDMEEKETVLKEILVAFQPVPSDCPRLGIDPRVVRSRIGEGRRWKVGVWGPWSKVEFPISRQELEGSGRRKGSEDEEGENEEMEKDESEARTKVLMATRYLVAQAEA